MKITYDPSATGTKRWILEQEYITGVSNSSAPLSFGLTHVYKTPVNIWTLETFKIYIFSHTTKTIAGISNSGCDCLYANYLKFCGINEPEVDFYSILYKDRNDQWRGKNPPRWLEALIDYTDNLRQSKYAIEFHTGYKRRKITFGDIQNYFSNTMEE